MCSQILTPDLRVEQAVGFKNCGCTIDLMVASIFVAKHIHEHRNRRKLPAGHSRAAESFGAEGEVLGGEIFGVTGLRVFHCISWWVKG